MGFLDKAKKLAEQAQTKMDEVQKDFNAKQGGQQSAGEPTVEYDQHGRPATPQASTPEAPAPAPTAAPDTPASADPAPSRPHGDPLETGEDASRHGADADRGERPATPPSGGSGLTSGDPLGG